MDLYQTLGVSQDAPADQIRSAYRKLAQKHHPDKNQGKSEAKAKMQEIQRAYDVLGNAEKRKHYDETGQTQEAPNKEETAKTYLAKLVIELIEKIFTESFDLKKEADLQIKENIRNLEKKIKNQKRKCAKIEKAKKRLTHKKNGDPFLIQALEQTIHHKNQTIGQLKQNVEIGNLMLKMLADYDYRVDETNHAAEEFSIALSSEPFFKNFSI